MAYFPPKEKRDPKPEQCPGCEGWFLMNTRKEGIGCLAMHGPGSCCHFNDTPTEAPNGGK